MGKRLRFRLTNAISKVLLINLKRGGRVKPGKKKSELNPHRLRSPEIGCRRSPSREEEVSLIIASPPKSSKKSKSKMFRYTCCKQDEAIQENCHMKVVATAQESSPEEDSWEREGFWNVYAEVDNKLVRKKVVLKKKSSKSSKATRTECESTEMNLLKEPARCSSFSHQQQQCGVSSSTFRLSTSSGDASLGPESLAWDKEHSLFASDDSGSSSTRPLTLHRRGTSSEVDEDFGKLLMRNLSLSSSSNRSSPRNKALSRGSGHRDEILLLSPSTSHHSHQRAAAASTPLSRKLSALESNSKSWEGTRLLTSCSGCSTQSSALKPKSKTKMKTKLTRGSEILEEVDDESLDCPRVRGKVRESVPVMLVSSDPYQDFRRSMVQMITEKRLSRSSDLEELLECYLYLNPPGFHEVIVQVFTDLWLHTLLEPEQKHQVGPERQRRSRRRTSSF